MSMQREPGATGVQPEVHPRGGPNNTATPERIMLEAVRALEDEGQAAFFSVMWLAFGDGWTARRAALRKAGLIDHPKDDPHRPSITPQGRAWAAGGGGPIARGTGGPAKNNSRGRRSPAQRGGRESSASAGDGHAGGALHPPLQPQA
ncbi:MAG: hypothetical protein AAF356_08295 [Planctomycetota bacterium]